MRQAKFLPPQPRHRTNYLISVYSACRVTGSTTELTLASRRTKRNLETMNYADMELTAEDEGKQYTSVV